jgi:hypothetical protein
MLCLHYTIHSDNIITVTGTLGMSLSNKSINQTIGMNPAGYGSTMRITDGALGHYHEENSSMQCTFFQPLEV